MISVLYYAVVTFIRAPNGELTEARIEPALSKNMARYQAAAIVGHKIETATIVGAIAISRVDDARLREFATVEILGRYGETPVDFEGMA